MGSGFFLLVSIVALIILGLAFARDYKKKAQLESEIKSWQNKIATLEKKNQDLNSLIEYYTSDEFMEKEMRLRLGLKKPGEQVVVLPSEDSGMEATNADTDSVKSNWQKWWNYFFK